MSTMFTKEQPVVGRGFVEKEIDSVPCPHAPQEAGQWRLLGALEELERSAQEPEAGKKLVASILAALDALENSPVDIRDAVEAVNELPEVNRVEWYRHLGPTAKEAALRSVSEGKPDMLREYISSGFAVLNFPESGQVKEAAREGFDKLVARLGLDLKAPLAEVGSKIAKLGALAGMSQEDVWAGVLDSIPFIADKEGAAAFVLLTFPVSTGSPEDFKKLPPHLREVILDAPDYSYSEIPAEVMRGRRVMPSDACEISRISRELYGAYYGTEVIVELGNSGNIAGFQRAWEGVQEIGYYQSYLDKAEPGDVLATTRHEIDHLETTLLARVKPEEAFATSSIEMIIQDKEDSRRLFPYGQYCRVDELRSYLLDHVHARPEDRLHGALHGKLIHEVFDAIVPAEIDIHSWKFYTGDCHYPGQVVARHVGRSGQKSENYALRVPLPDSRGVESPENEILLEKAVRSLREYVTSLGRYHLGDAEPAVQAERERIMRHKDTDGPLSVPQTYWPHFHKEPSIIEKTVTLHSSEWLEKLTSDKLSDVTSAVDLIAHAFTPATLVRGLRDEAIEQLAQLPHRIVEVQKAMKDLNGGNWPAQALTRAVAVNAAFTALGEGDLESFFSIVELPQLFRSSSLTPEAFCKKGEEAALLGIGGPWEKTYLRSFISPNRASSITDIDSSLVGTVAERVLELREMFKEESEWAKAERALSESGLTVRADPKGRIIVLPSDDSELGRFATACFTGAGGMRLILENDGGVLYDYSTHTLSLGISGDEDLDLVASQMKKGLDFASRKMLFRADARNDYYLVVQRSDPGTGRTQMVLIENEDVADLSEKENEWAVDLLKEFFESNEQDAKLPIKVEPDVRNGAWNFSGKLEYATGKITLGGTSGLDRLNEEGVTSEVFLPLRKQLEEAISNRSF